MEADDGLAAALARLIGLPPWLPRAVTEGAILVLAVTYVLSPQTVIDAFNLYIAAETEHLLGLMKPMFAPDPVPGVNP